jgi:hypothetical protein
MSERPEISSFEPFDRLCCPGTLAGTDGIFSKPSYSVTFCNFEGQRDCAISLILQDELVEGRSRDSLRAPEELTRSGQG